MITPEEYIPILNAYRAEQLREMRENEHKATWKGLGVERALADVHYHVSKLDWAVRHRFESPERWDEVREFAADTGNLCAMLLDLLRDEAAERADLQVPPVPELTDAGRRWLEAIRRLDEAMLRGFAEMDEADNPY